VVKASADGLLRIRNDVLDVPKIEAGQFDLESIDFQLDDMLNEATRVLGPQAAGSGTELLIDVASEIPPCVHGDPVRLCQIITNFLSNAVKITGGRDIVLGVSQVDSDESGARIQFSVKDTGIGIPTENQDRVFGEFEQADQSTTGVHGGSGLGLTTSRRLVEMMGEVLELRSDPGSGVTSTSF
jgi:signal transduction histidine kinase